MKLSRRYAAILLTRPRVELAHAEKSPSAIVVARTPDATEAQLLGNTRLGEVSAQAHSLGIRPGQTIAQARARASDLIVRVVHEGAITGLFARICEMALAFGETVSFDAAENVVWVDISGCGHLFATSDDRFDDIPGERTLATKLEASVVAMGHACRVVVADGPEVALTVARVATKPAVIPPGRSAEALKRIHISALPIDEATAHWLLRVGMQTVFDLQSLPRASLGARLGANAKRVMALLDGDDRQVLVPYVPPEVPEERVELEYGVSANEPLLFVVRGLTSRIEARLFGRGRAASVLELVFAMDRALLPKGAPRDHTIVVPLPSPLHTASDLFAVLRAREFQVPAPVLAVTLRVTSLTDKKSEPLDLFVPDSLAERALPRLAAELSVELGETNVGVLSLENAWQPDARSRLVPCFTGQSSSSEAPRMEPSRIVMTEAAPDHRIVEHLIRLDGVEWWHPPAKTRPRCDYVMAWVEERQAMAWIELHRSGSTPGSRLVSRIVGWMD